MGTRLLLLSGLGVNEHLLDRQRTLPLMLETLPWIEPQKYEPLSHYAGRMARLVQPGGRLFIGGISFGAMVALEIARLIPTAGVFMIAGALSGKAIAPQWKPIAYSLPLVPLFLAPPIFAISPLLYPLLGVRKTPDRQLLDKVLPQASPNLFRWGAWAVASWRPTPPLPNVLLFHIHGENDLIIPVQPIPGQAIVRGAGHLVNLTHANAVNAFIMNRIGAMS